MGKHRIFQDQLLNEVSHRLRVLYVSLVTYATRFYTFNLNIGAFGVTNLSFGTLGVPLRMFANLAPQKVGMVGSPGAFASIL